ncbi:Ankyrin repeat domain-containing protein 50 [Trapelia coarctata]|nr:Ankyrin repeat domain-containing protein 50 [Trapelia coarctata]
MTQTPPNGRASPSPRSSNTKVPSPNSQDPVKAPASSIPPTPYCSTPVYPQIFPSPGHSRNVSSPDPPNPFTALASPGRPSTPYCGEISPSPGPASPNPQSVITAHPSPNSQNPSTGPASSSPLSAAITVSSPPSQNASTGPGSPELQNDSAEPASPKSQNASAGPASPTSQNASTGPTSPKLRNPFTEPAPPKPQNPLAGLPGENVPDNPCPRRVKSPPRGLFRTTILRRPRPQTPSARPPRGNFPNPAVLPPANSPNQSAGPSQRSLQNPSTGSPPNSKNIIITRGAQSTSLDLAHRLISKGHRVCILDTRVGKPAFVEGFDPLLRHACYEFGNVRSPPELTYTVAVICERFFRGNRIDVLITNADIIGPGWPEGLLGIVDAWNAYVETSMTTAFVTVQACIPHMYFRGPKADNDPGPCIINICPYRVSGNEPECEGYIACRAGVLGLSGGLAAHYRDCGIRVNAIVPGCIETKDEKWYNMRKRKWDEQHGGNRLLHRNSGNGEDIFGAVEYLMGAGFVSGTEIVMDGAISAFKALGPMAVPP